MVGSEKVRATNVNCELVTMVKHDRSEPLVDVTYCECPLIQGEKNLKVQITIKNK